MTGAWLGTPMPGEPGPADRDDARRRTGEGSAGGAGVLHVDCDQCAVRGPACGECVISVLLGPPDDTVGVGGVVGAGGGVGGGQAGSGADVAVGRIDLNLDEQSALAALAGSGLVPPLRLVSSVAAPSAYGSDPVAGAPDDPPEGGDDGWDDAWFPDDGPGRFGEDWA